MSKMNYKSNHAAETSKCAQPELTNEEMALVVGGSVVECIRATWDDAYYEFAHGNIIGGIGILGELNGCK